VEVESVRRVDFNKIAPAQAAKAARALAGSPDQACTQCRAQAGVLPAADNRGQGDAAGTESSDQRDIAELRHGLLVEVAQLSTLTRLLGCSDRRGLILFLAGRPMPGLTAYPPTDPARNKIVFRLERTEENAKEWTYLLGRPSLGTVDVNVSVGFNDSYAIPSSETVKFRAIPVGWSMSWLGIMVVFGLVVLWAARRTGMLRDSGIVDGGKPPMFSLGRVQLAFWTFIVISSFVFIGMITGDYLSSMKEHVLALLGISVGTSLGSSIIDNGASGTAPRAALASTGSWWRDILNDGKDISLHRFQMAAWTIVLGIIFVHGVYSKLDMPEFPATLLGLMGISAGTYLGLKVTQETPQPGAAGAQPVQGGAGGPNGAGGAAPPRPGSNNNPPPAADAQPPH
jgi:hypothetical protein